MLPRTLAWVPADGGRLTPGRVRFIDQTRLPNELREIETDDVRVIGQAIRSLQIRGAPAIGVAAAMGVALAAQARAAGAPADVLAAAREACDDLARARPTAVNLFHALRRMRGRAEAEAGRPAPELAELLAREAVACGEEDVAMCRAIGRHGATLLQDGQTVLTHCNAGSLATAHFGTALSAIYVAREEGKRIRVFADETRPLLQGARLTAWELQQAGVDVTLICDNTAAQVMREGRIDAVLVGADRIAANGDTANKIGTYSVAVNARHHGIPFYVLAPLTSFDLALAGGADIPIEHRHGDEVTEGFGRRTAPAGVAVYSPAFDVTPAELITAIVCERGIARPPCAATIRRLAGSAAP